MTVWKFLPSPRNSRRLFSWCWLEERDGAAIRKSARTFDLYFECLKDARGNGYAGPNPRPHAGAIVGESKKRARS
jgi:hypothetical protein